MVISSIAGKCILMTIGFAATCMASLIYHLFTRLKKHDR